MKKLGRGRFDRTPDYVSRMARSISDTAALKRERELFMIGEQKIIGWAALVERLGFRENTLRMKFSSGKKSTGREEFTFGPDEILVRRLRLQEA